MGIGSWKKMAGKVLRGLQGRGNGRVVDNYFGKPILNQQEGNALIGSLIVAGNPLLVARIGGTELSCIRNYLTRVKNSGFAYEELVRKYMSLNSGFFPVNDEMLDRFSRESLDHLGNVDIMSVWFNEMEDHVCHKYCQNASLVRLRSIEPYYHERPWSAGLKGKKVLVIHPFEETIRFQYENRRDRLFANPDVLPEFSLETVKAVQTLAYNQAPFDNWFQAYEHMCAEIIKKDFDVALIGAGAYGLPLGSFVKQQGKQAIHMGGATQILFGIKGRRWDDHEVISTLYNDYWVRPAESEVPQGFSNVENGCYW